MTNIVCIDYETMNIICGQWTIYLCILIITIHKTIRCINLLMDYYK